MKFLRVGRVLSHISIVFSSFVVFDFENLKPEPAKMEPIVNKFFWRSDIIWVVFLSSEKLFAKPRKLFNSSADPIARILREFFETRIPVAKPVSPLSPFLVYIDTN